MPDKLFLTTEKVEQKNDPLFTSQNKVNNDPLFLKTEPIETQPKLGLDPLSELDDYITTREKIVRGATAMDLMKATLKGFARAALETPQRIAEFDRYVGETSVLPKKNIGGSITSEELMFGLVTPNQLERTPDTKLIEKSKKLIQANKDFINKKFPNLKPNTDDKFEQFMFDVGQGGFSLLTALGVSVITKNPNIAAVMFGLQQRYSSFVEMVDAGVDIDTANSLSLAAGVIEGGLEYVGLDAFLKVKGGVLSKALTRMVTEGLQEASQTAGERAVFVVSGASEYKGLVKEISDILYSGAVGSIVAGGTSVSLDYAQKSNMIKSLQTIGFSKKDAADFVRNMEINATGETDNVVGDELQERAQQLANEIPEPEIITVEVSKKIEANTEELVDIDEITKPLKSFDKILSGLKSERASLENEIGGLDLTGEGVPQVLLDRLEAIKTEIEEIQKERLESVPEFDEFIAKQIQSETEQEDAQVADDIYTRSINIAEEEGIDLSGENKKLFREDLQERLEDDNRESMSLQSIITETVEDWKKAQNKDTVGFEIVDIKGLFFDKAQKEQDALLSEIKKRGGVRISKKSTFKYKEYSENGLLSVLNKSGRALDQIAQELEGEGLIFTPEGTTPENHLMELLMEERHTGESGLIGSQEDFEIYNQEELIEIARREIDNDKDFFVWLSNQMTPNQFADWVGKTYGWKEYKKIIRGVKNSKRKAQEIEDRFPALKPSQIKDSILKAKQVKPVVNYMTGVSKLANRVITTEAKILKDRLRAEQKASKEGLAEGKRQEKIITQEVREKGKERLELEKEKGKERLELEKEKGKERISQLRERNRIQKEQRVTRNKIKRLVRSIENLTRRNVPIEYKDQIQTILEKFDLRFRSKKVIQRRESIKEFIDNQIALGEEIHIPQQLINKVDAITLNDMSLDDLQSLHSVIKQLVHIGGLKSKLIANNKNRNFTAIRDEIVKSASHYLKTGKVDETPVIQKQLAQKENKLSLLRGFFSSMDKVEFLARTADGEKQGAVQDNIIEPIQKAATDEHILNEEYLGKLRSATEKISNKLKDVFNTKHNVAGLQLTKNNMMSIYANSKNDGNLQRLVEGNGLTIEQINEITEWLSKNHPDLIKYTDDVMEIIQSQWDKINEVKLRLTGERLGKISGYYPIYDDSDFSLQAKARESQKDLMRLVITKAYVESGHTKQRVGGNAPVVIDFFKVATKHIRWANHYVSHAIPVRDVNKLLKDAQIGDVFTRGLSKEAFLQFDKWLRVVANPRTITQDSIDDISNLVMRNFSTAVLGVKVSVALNQFGSFSQTIDEIGVKDAMAGLIEFYQNPWKATQFIYSLSIDQKNREQTFDREVVSFIESKKTHGLLGSSKNAGDIFYSLIKFVDKAATLPSWLGAYRKFMRETNGNQQKSIELANGVVRRTQPMGTLKDLPDIARQRGFKKALTMFYSHFANLHNRLTATARYLKLSDDQFNTKISRLVSSVLWNIVVPVMYTSFITSGFKRWNLKDIAKDGLAYSLGGFVLLRDMVQLLEIPNAPLTPFGTIGREAVSVVRNITSGKPEKAVRSGVKLGGYVFGVPTPQAIITYDGMMDLINGETDDWRRLLLSKYKLGEDEDSSFKTIKRNSRQIKRSVKRNIIRR